MKLFESFDANDSLPARGGGGWAADASTRRRRYQHCCRFQRLQVQKEGRRCIYKRDAYCRRLPLCSSRRRDSRVDDSGPAFAQQQHGVLLEQSRDELLELLAGTVFTLSPVLCSLVLFKKVLNTADELLSVHKLGEQPQVERPKKKSSKKKKEVSAIEQMASPLLVDEMEMQQVHCFSPLLLLLFSALV